MSKLKFTDFTKEESLLLGGYYIGSGKNIERAVELFNSHFGNGVNLDTKDAVQRLDMDGLNGSRRYLCIKREIVPYANVCLSYLQCKGDFVEMQKYLGIDEKGLLKICELKNIPLDILTNVPHKSKKKKLAITTPSVSCSTRKHGRVFSGKNSRGE